MKISTDTDTDSHIFNHRNGLLSGNNNNMQQQQQQQQYQPKFQHDPYMLQPQVPQQQQQQQDDTMYREQPAMTMNREWPQVAQFPGKQQGVASIWPDKLSKQNAAVDASPKVVVIEHNKKEHNKEYSEEEYAEGDENQVADGEDSTTTEAPKKVSR